MNQKSQDVFQQYNLPFETYFNKGVNHISQIHDEIELVWVIKGHSSIICEGEKYYLTPQTLFMINSYQNHKIISDSEALFITFRFKKDYLASLHDSYVGMFFENRIYTLEELVFKYKEIPLIISQMISLLIDRNPTTLVRYKIIGYYNILIYELYTMLLREKYLDVKKVSVPVYLNRLKDITDYINSNFIKKITLEDLSKHIGLSTFRLSHFIKDNIGISFREYLSNLRVEYALRLLRESSFSVLQISEKSGFSDVKYLNKYIKDRLGMTALKYRKKQNESEEFKLVQTEEHQDFFKELKQCLSYIKYLSNQAL